MASKSTGDRPLEQMGINAESELPEGIPTPGSMKSVRFSQTNPGYHFREVEKYKDTVDETLAAYAALLHSRDVDIHKLDDALSRSQVDLINKTSQIEVLLAKNGMVQETKNDEEVETLLQANQLLKNDITTLTQERDAVAEQLNSLEAWARQMEEYVAALETQNAELLETASSAQTVTPVEEVEEYVEPEEVYEEEPVFVEPEYTEPEPVQAQPFTIKQSVNAPRQFAPKVNQKQPPANKIAPDVAKRFPGIRPEDLE